MIIEKESEIKVLRNFCENPFGYFSIAEISEKTRISRNWIYGIIEKFEKRGLLSISGKKYKLDFSCLFCKRLKLLFDSDYLNSLDKKLEDNILTITNKLIFEIKPWTIVLVGSAASNKYRKESDIDFLVVSENKEIPDFESSNIVLLSPAQLKEKYLKGDDFVISALLFGKIVYDNNYFINFFESPLPIFSQEIIQEKIKYCEQLEERIYTLLKTDEIKAGEELLYLALQAARIILLKNRIAPRTKYDIAGQVRPFNKKIALIIEYLLKKRKLAKENILEYNRICKDAVLR